mgnify:FL=1
MKNPLLVLLALCWGAGVGFAQTRVSGVIKDAADGQPIPYAGITVKGTTAGVVSNDQGVYSIPIPKDGTVLVFSYLGYDPLEVPIEGKTRIDVQLKKSVVDMDAVVVTGFRDVKKQTFTGSSVKLNASDMEMAGATDVSRMLEGKVAGVSIQNVSGTFGAAPKVRIRGVTSINGDNKPLWVVDGVVLEDVVDISNDQLSSGDPTTLLGSSVAGINPADIETFDILKDAAATALYGARAMNGVVVITTKRGSRGAPVITYNGNFTMRTKPSYDQYNIMNSAEQMAVYAEMESKGYLKPDIVNQANSGIYGIMYNRINTYDRETGKFLLENTPAARKAFLMKYAHANTDWFDLLFKNSLMNEHTLSISSGSERSRTYASVGFLNDAGWTVADRVNRYTVNFRNDFDVSKKIKTGLQVVGSVRQQEAPGSFSRKTDVVTGEYTRDFDINPFSYALNTSRALRPFDENGNYEHTTMNYAPFNILEELDNNGIRLTVVDIKLQGEFTYEILPGFKYNFVGALRYVNSDQEHRVTEYANAANAYRAAGNSTIRQANPYLYRDPNDPSAEPMVVLPYGGFYNTAQNQMFNYDVRNSLSYNKLWNNERTQELSALAGIQVKYTDRRITSTTGYGYQYDMGGVVSIDPKLMEMMIDRQFPYYSMGNRYDRFAAFYANVDYTYDRRYSVSATGRYDGSNALGKGASARWLPTWNIGAKWNITGEKFMENIGWIDLMSIRASYGLTASMPSTTNSSAIFYNEEIFRPGDTENSIYISNLQNSELTWEKSYQFNVGYDLTLFGNRLNFSFDYFNRQSFDLIAPIKVSGVGGEMWKYANYADLDAQGFDVTLGGTLIRNKDWNWSANLTLGYSKNFIRNARNMPEVFDLVRAEGGNKNDYPVNSLFSVPFAGLNPANGVPQFYDKDGNVTYDCYMQGIETDFLKYEGQIDPKYTGGLNTTLRWKNLSLNVFFTFQAGNVIRLNPVFSSSYDDTRALPKEFKDRWAVSGDEAYTDIPSIVDAQTRKLYLSSVYPYNNYNYSDARVAKGDFIRLKSLSLNYNLPASWLRSTRVFKTASVRVTGKDLWLLYSDSALNGQDPEFYNTGGVAMPIQPQCIVSLSLGF